MDPLPGNLFSIVSKNDIGTTKLRFFCTLGIKLLIFTKFQKQYWTFSIASHIANTFLAIAKKNKSNNFTEINKKNPNIAIGILKNGQVDSTKIILHFGCINFILVDCS